jgi:hypothetical protein
MILEFWKKHKKVGRIVLAGLAAMGVVLWYESGFYEWNLKNAVRMLSDAAFVPGVFLVCFGVLMLVAHSGAFDSLAYVHYTAMRVFSPRKNKLEVRKRFLDYKMDKERTRAENGEPPKYLACVGGVFLGTSILLAVVFLML